MLCNLEIIRLFKFVFLKWVFDEKIYKKLVVLKFKFGIVKKYVLKIEICWYWMCFCDVF